MNPSIILKKGKEKSLRRGHSWIFSGAISRKEGEIDEGDWVEILSHDGRRLGMGHYANGSISVRMLHWSDQLASKEAIYHTTMGNAINYRKRLGLLDREDINSYRLIFGEGDGLPGLVVDKYEDVLVMQAHTIGMLRDLDIISNIIRELCPFEINAIYNKSKESLKKADTANEYLFGVANVPRRILENGLQFLVDWENGQKTGFFIDQRDSRALLSSYCKDKKVLNTFCYTGGFSAYALQGGASLVHSVDVSAKAIDLTDQNIALTDKSERHQSYCQDVFEFMKTMTEDYDIVVLDPPAFAKRRNRTHNAVQGYKRLNAMAINKIKQGGLIFTFSCSQNISSKLFEDTIRAAAIEVGRKCRILHRLSQPADHPIALFHPEGHYLKGLVIEVGEQLVQV